MPRILPSSKAILTARRIRDSSLRASTLAKIAIVEAQFGPNAFDTIAVARTLAVTEKDSATRCCALCDIAIAEHAAGLDSRGTLQDAEEAALDATRDVRPMIHLFLTQAKIGLDA